MFQKIIGGSNQYYYRSRGGSRLSRKGTIKRFQVSFLLRRIARKASERWEIAPCWRRQGYSLYCAQVESRGGNVCRNVRGLGLRRAGGVDECGDEIVCVFEGVAEIYRSLHEFAGALVEIVRDAVELAGNGLRAFTRSRRRTILADEFVIHRSKIININDISLGQQLPTIS